MYQYSVYLCSKDVLYVYTIIVLLMYNYTVWSTYMYVYPSQPVLMDSFALWMVLHRGRDEWRCVSTIHMALCAMTSGGSGMLRWYAGSLDLQLNVCVNCISMIFVCRSAHNNVSNTQKYDSITPIDHAFRTWFYLRIQHTLWIKT